MEDSVISGFLILIFGLLIGGGLFSMANATDKFIIDYLKFLLSTNEIEVIN